MPRIKGLYEPRKSISPYGLFFRDNHSKIRESTGYATFGVVAKAVGAMWRNANEDVRVYYRNRVMDAKEAYVKSFATYLLHPKHVSSGYSKTKRNCHCNMEKIKVSVCPRGYSGSAKEENNTPTDKNLLCHTRKGNASICDGFQEFSSSESKGAKTRPKTIADEIHQDGPSTSSGVVNVLPKERYYEAETIESILAGL